MPPSALPAPRSALRRFAIVASTGALMGFVLFCVFGPRVLGWWYTPPAKEAFSCGASVSDALGEFVKFQLGAAVGGAVTVLVLVALVRRFWSRFTAKPAGPSADQVGPVGEGGAPLPPSAVMSAPPGVAAVPPGPKPE
jgi:hypothetical protein